VPAHDLGRRPAQHPLDGLGEVRDLAVGVGGVDDVGRVLDQEPVALLRLAQLRLEPLALGDVARDAIHVLDLAVADDRHGADLERPDGPVAVPEVEALGLGAAGLAREVPTRRSRPRPTRRR